MCAFLVREYRRRGAIDVRRFYVRRARRLFPALAGLLLGVGLYLLVADPGLNPLMELLPALLYLMNRVRAFEIHDAVLKEHTWSLAIEEQYYFLRPLLFFAWAARPHSMRRVVSGLAVLLALVLVWRWQRVVLQQIDAGSARVIYGSETRADGLPIGGLIALLSPRLLSAFACSGPLALICLMWIVFFRWATSLR